MITVTEAAKTRIMDLIIEENDPRIKLRIYIQGGGCAGFSYGFSFDSEQNDDDFPIDFVMHGRVYTLLLDSISSQYLVGSTVDFVEDLQGTRFTIDNPNAQTTCGCGSSFSVM